MTKEIMYGMKKTVPCTFEVAVEKVREALQKEGFGVLTEIDVKATLKKKLNVDFKKYIILGACNPPFAYKALTTEEDIGLMLPCNMIVYENGDSVVVAAIKPTIAMQSTNNQALRGIAEQVEEKLGKILQSL